MIDFCKIGLRSKAVQELCHINFCEGHENKPINCVKKIFCCVNVYAKVMWFFSYLITNI